MSSNYSENKNRTQPKAEQDSDAPAWLTVVREQVSSLKYGTVQITIHDSRVTQVERSEKLRLDQPK